MKSSRKTGLASAERAGFLNGSGSVAVIDTAHYGACLRSSGVGDFVFLDSPSSGCLFLAERDVAIDESSGDVL